MTPQDAPWLAAPPVSPAAPVRAAPWLAAPPVDPADAIDYSAPRSEVWAAIDKLPEERKYDAYKKWAEKRVARERAGTNFPQLPNSGAGIPLIGGLLDEGASAVNAGLEAAVRAVNPWADKRSYGALYDEELALTRERERQAREAAPVMSVAGDVAAGLATGGPLLRYLPAGGTTLVGQTATGAGVGAGLGAAEGYARGEGSITDRARAAESAAKWGALFGAAAPAGIYAGASAYSAAMPLVSTRLPGVKARLPRWLTRAGPEDLAKDILAARVRTSGATPEDLARYFERGKYVSKFHSNSEVPNPQMLADASNDLTRLTGSVYRTGGEAGSIVKRALDERQMGARNPYAPVPPGAPPEGQAERVEAAVRRTLLKETKGTARQTAEDLDKGRSAAADAAYAAARQNSEPFDLTPAIEGAALRLQQTGHTDAGRLIKKGIDLFLPKRSTARLAGPDGRAMRGESFAVNNIERFDIAYQQLADLIDQAYKNGNGYAGRILTKFKNDLLQEVHAYDAAGIPTKNALYQQARNAYRLASDELEAIELGRRALREDSGVSIETWRSLDPAHKHLFRLGLEEEVRTATGRLTLSQDATRLFQTRRIHDLFREVIPRSQSAKAVFADRPERFGEYIERQRHQAAVRQNVLGGTQTAERLQDDSKYAADAVHRFVQGVRAFGNIGLELLAEAARKAFGMRQDVSVELARILTAADPDTIRAALDTIANRYGRFAVDSFTQQVRNYGLLLIPAAPIETPDERRR